MPSSEWGWEITPEEFASWIVEDTPDLAVLNKPPFVVCHPSKHGSWSSLIGAAREYFGLPVVHMPFRLDRETSGVWLAAKTKDRGVQLQRAVQERRVEKEYLAILEGELTEVRAVDQLIGKAEGSAVWVKRGVRGGGQPAWTLFEPLEVRGGCTLARVVPKTGRLHQIRVHAAWMGHPLIGDKIYAADERIFLNFIENGPECVADVLRLPRHALHCSKVSFQGDSAELFEVPLAGDLVGFWEQLT